jgi:hypothetical protein
MYETIKKRIERWQYHQDQIKDRVKEKRKGNEPQVYANVSSKNVKAVEGPEEQARKEKEKKKRGDDSGGKEANEAPGVIKGSPLKLKNKNPESEGLLDFQ